MQHAYNFNESVHVIGAEIVEGNLSRLSTVTPRTVL